MKLGTALFLILSSANAVSERRAGCEIIKNEKSWLQDQELTGRIEFVESMVVDRKNGGKLRTQTTMFSTWKNLKPHESHVLSIINDDDSESVDCSGTPFVKSLGSTLSTNEEGIGSVKGQFLTAKVTGEASFVGKYLQVADTNGEAVVCCKIVEISE